MARGEQLVRQHRILQILEGSRYGRTLRELRDELVEQLGLARISQRTVRRDLEALQAAGVDVDSHHGAERTVWKLGPGMRKLPKIETSATEMLALSLARDLLVPLTGTPYWQGIETLWHKMENALPDAVWKHFDRLRESVVVRGSPARSYAEKQGILATLNRAILQRRVVELKYVASGRKRAASREIEPYAVVVYRGSLYVVAAACEAPAEQAIRHFKLDRIRKATALDRRFKPRGDFDPQEHFASSIGVFRAGKPIPMEIWCSRKIAPWIQEHPWHPEQRVESRKEGDVVVTLPSVFEEEIIPRVLALGAEAEVLSPESSRRKIVETVKRLDDRYS